MTCEDLREYLQRPLRIKIPIIEELHQKVIVLGKLESVLALSMTYLNPNHVNELEVKL